MISEGYFRFWGSHLLVFRAEGQLSAQSQPQQGKLFDLPCIRRTTRTTSHTTNATPIAATAQSCQPILE